MIDVILHLDLVLATIFRVATCLEKSGNLKVIRVMSGKVFVPVVR